MTAATPTDRPKSMSAIVVKSKFLVVFFYVVTLLLGFFCMCRCFCHRTESDLFLLSLVGLLKITCQLSVISVISPFGNRVQQIMRLGPQENRGPRQNKTKY